MKTRNALCDLNRTVHIKESLITFLMLHQDEWDGLNGIDHNDVIDQLNREILVARHHRNIHLRNEEEMLADAQVPKVSER